MIATILDYSQVWVVVGAMLVLWLWLVASMIRK